MPTVNNYIVFYSASISSHLLLLFDAKIGFGVLARQIKCFLVSKYWVWCVMETISAR